MFNLTQILRSLSFAPKSPYAFLSSSSSPLYSSAAPASSLTHRRFSSIDSMPPVNQFIDDTVSKNKIVVFSKSYCPYCRETKRYFANRYPGESVTVVEVDKRKDGSAIQDYLLKKTGARSVPRTFINGVSVGGNDDLHDKPRSEVDKLVAMRS